MALQVYRGGATAVQPVADPVKSPDSLMVSVLAEPEVVRKRRGDKWSWTTTAYDCLRLHTTAYDCIRLHTTKYWSTDTYTYIASYYRT